MKIISLISLCTYHRTAEVGRHLPSLSSLTPPKVQFSSPIAPKITVQEHDDPPGFRLVLGNDWTIKIHLPMKPSSLRAVG